MTLNIPSQQILALNDAENSENRIHSDDIAARYGFKGALVSGVNVFGYLTQPLVRIYGEQWLEKGIMDVLFLKPAYQHDLLSITTENLSETPEQRNHLTSAINEDGVLLARLESWQPNELPEINDLATTVSRTVSSTREEISWDRIKLMEPAPVFHWQPTEADNQRHVSGQRDQSPLYQGARQYIHPYYLLEMCNTALKNMFIMPAWVHTGSKLILREAVRVGDEWEVLAIPTEKWERKGHEFIKLYICFRSAERIALEVEHTAIFKLAET